MTWANQVKILKNQLQQLGIIFGQTFINAFRPALRAMNRFLSAVISFAQQVFNALGAIFGWKIEITSSGIKDELGDVADTVGDISDGAGGAGDNLGKAAKNAGKLKQQLQGFDKLNLLTSDSGSGSGGSGGKGGSGGSGGGSGGGGGSAGDDLAINISKQENPILSDIKNMFQLGKFVGDTIADALNNIDWTAIRAKARKFGTGLASFLNGFFSTDAMGELGEALAQSLNTQLEALYGFGKRFDWKQFGEKCSEFVGKFFDKFDWKLAADTIDVWVQGIADALWAFLTNPDTWASIWKAVGTIAVNLDPKTIVLIVGFFTLKNAIKTGALAAAVKTLLFGTGTATVGVGGVTASAAVNSATATAGSGFLATGGFAGAVKRWAAPLLLNPFTVAAAGVVAVGYVMYEAKRYLIDGKEARNGFEQGVYDWIDNLRSKMQKKMDERAGEDGLDYKPEVFVNPKMPEIDNIGDKKSGFNPAGALKQLRDGINYAFNKNPVEIQTKVSIENDKRNIKKLPETVSKMFGTAQLNAKGKYNTADRDIKVWKKDTTTAWNKYAKEGLRIGAKYGTTSKDADAWYRQTKTAWGNNRTVDITGNVIKAVDKLSKADKTINTTSKYSSAQEALSAAQKSINTLSKFTKAQDGIPAAQKILAAKANMNSAKDNVPASQKQVNAKANMNSARDNVPSSQRSISAKANLTHYTKTFSVIDGLKAKFTSFTKTFTIIDNLKAKISSIFRKDGGVYSNGKWSPIQQYDTGGSPSSGQLFYAREAGPELVGTLRGHTAVMNNDQIVASVSAGVAKAGQAQVEVLRQQNQILMAILNKRTGIDADSIFNAVRAKDIAYKQRTGRSAFSY